MHAFVRIIPVLLIFVIASPLHSQAQPAGAPKSDELTEPGAIVSSLKDQLRNLVSAQEYFYSKNNKYSNSLKELGYIARQGAYVMVWGADARGWNGRAVHPGIPGKSCVIWVGPDVAPAGTKTDANQLSGAEGAPVCDP